MPVSLRVRVKQLAYKHQLRDVDAKRIIDALDFVDWFKGQDLIRREDVMHIWCAECEINDESFCKKECGFYAIVKGRPKAEPPKVSEIKRGLNETKNERNGDCETCKHLNDERHCRDCYSRYGEDPSCYEPYIPKENK